MKRAIIVVLFLFGTTAIAMGADDSALSGQMKKDCASLFSDGAPCFNLAKGNRKCVRQNLEKGGAACVTFEKAHKDFFDAGMKNEIIKNK